MVYNASGQTLRAARTSHPLIVENFFYWWRTENEQEAAYLVALLNAEVLQPLYRAARKSDRHFHQHIWREVPIPRYNSNNRHHAQIAVLCAQAEQIAKDAMAGIQAGGQVKTSTTIRTALSDFGLTRDINQLAARIVR